MDALNPEKLPPQQEVLSLTPETAFLDAKHAVEGRIDMPAIDEADARAAALSRPMTSGIANRGVNPMAENRPEMVTRSAGWTVINAGGDVVIGDKGDKVDMRGNSGQLAYKVGGDAGQTMGGEQTSAAKRSEHVSDESHQDSEEPPDQPEEEPAPVVDESEQPDGDTTLVPAPVDNESSAPAPEPTVDPSPPAVVELPPQTINIAIAGDTHHIVDVARQGRDFQMRLRQRGSGRILPARMWDGIKNLASGFWQRGILSPVFREREERFRRDVLINSGMTDLPNDVIEKAIEQGKIEVGKRSFLRRKTWDAFTNLLANTFGFETADRAEGKKWLKEQIRRARAGGGGDPLVAATYKESIKEREAFGARLALTDDRFALRGKDERVELTNANPNLNHTLTEDFFRILTPYINGTITETEARTRVENFIKTDLRSRLQGSAYNNLNSALVSMGTNMLQAADIIKANKDKYVAARLITGDINDQQTWINAARAGTLNLNFYLARAEMKPGMREESKLEAVARRLHLRSEFAPAIMSSNKLKNVGKFFIKFDQSLIFNEVTAAGVGGYLGSLVTSLIPADKSKLAIYATVLGVPITAVTAGGLIAAAPVIAGGAAAAGLFAAAREVARLKGEWKNIEVEASHSIIAPVTTSRGPLHNIVRAIYGAVNREELMKKIADQRKASEILDGLRTQSGLFSDPADLTKPIPANVPPESVQKALHWLVESKVRIDLSQLKNRRFIRYDGTMTESQQQTLIDGLGQEVFARLSYLLLPGSGQQNLIDTFLVDGITNFQELYNKLYDAYKYNLLGDTKKYHELENVARLLGSAENAGFVEEESGLSKRNAAFRNLAIGHFVHRTVGVAVSSFVAGEAALKMRNFLAGTPDIFPGVDKKVVVSGRAPGSEVEFHNAHIQPPTGYQLDDAHTRLIKPDGTFVDLKPSLNSDGTVDPDKLKDILGKQGLKFDGVEAKQPEFTEPLYDRTFKIGNTEATITVPGEVKFHVNNDNFVDSINVKGANISLSHPLNPTDPSDLADIRSLLEKQHLNFKVFDPRTGEKLHELVTNSPVEQHLDAKDVWNKLKTDLDERKWYGYNEAGSQNNELRFYTFKKGDSVILDMSKMKEGWQNGVDPDNLNVADMIKNGNKELGFYFTLPGQAKGGVFIPDGLDGKVDGQLTLDPNSTVVIPHGGGMTLGQFSRMVLNADAVKNATGTPAGSGLTNIATELRNQQDVFRVDHIEAGVLRNHNGKIEFDAFATITGKPSQFPNVIDGAGGTVRSIRYEMEALPSTSGYSVYKFSLQASEASGNGGSFAMGVLPVTFTDYAEVGKNPVRTEVTGSRVPPYEFTRTQSGIPLTPPPPSAGQTVLGGGAAPAGQVVSAAAAVPTASPAPVVSAAAAAAAPAPASSGSAARSAPPPADQREAQTLRTSVEDMHTFIVDEMTSGNNNDRENMVEYMKDKLTDFGIAENEIRAQLATDEGRLNLAYAIVAATEKIDGRSPSDDARIALLNIISVRQFTDANKALISRLEKDRQFNNGLERRTSEDDFINETSLESKRAMLATVFDQVAQAANNSGRLENYSPAEKELILQYLMYFQDPARNNQALKAALEFRIAKLKAISVAPTVGPATAAVTTPASAASRPAPTPARPVTAAATVAVPPRTPAAEPQAASAGVVENSPSELRDKIDSLPPKLMPEVYDIKNILYLSTLAESDPIYGQIRDIINGFNFDDFSPEYSIKRSEAIEKLSKIILDTETDERVREARCRNLLNYVSDIHAHDKADKEMVKYLLREISNGNDWLDGLNDNEISFWSEVIDMEESEFQRLTQTIRGRNFLIKKYAFFQAALDGRVGSQGDSGSIWRLHEDEIIGDSPTENKGFLRNVKNAWGLRNEINSAMKGEEYRKASTPDEQQKIIETLIGEYLKDSAKSSSLLSDLNLGISPRRASLSEEDIHIMAEFLEKAASRPPMGLIKFTINRRIGGMNSIYESVMDDLRVNGNILADPPVGAPVSIPPAVEAYIRGKTDFSFEEDVLFENDPEVKIGAHKPGQISIGSIEDSRKAILRSLNGQTNSKLKPWSDGTLIHIPFEAIKEDKSEVVVVVTMSKDKYNRVKSQLNAMSTPIIRRTVNTTPGRVIS